MKEEEERYARAIQIMLHRFSAEACISSKPLESPGVAGWRRAPALGKVGA